MKQLIHLSAAALAVWCIAGYAQSIAPVAAGIPAPATAAAAIQTTDIQFADALQLYRQGRWSAAYGRFVQLADGGHVESARIALVMVRHGADLYGTEWTATQPQVSAWERMVGATGPLHVAYVGE